MNLLESIGGPGLGAMYVGGPRVSSPEAGWDTMTQRYLIESDLSTLSSTLSSLFAKGNNALDFPTMYVVSNRLAGSVGDWHEVDVAYKGMLYPKPYKVTRSNFVGEVSGEDITNDWGGIYPGILPKAQISQAAVSVVTSYLTTSEPSSEAVGKEVDLTLLPSDYPAFPSPPSNIFSSISDPTYVYPSGWVLERRDPEKLAGANIWNVTDHHVFRQALTI